MKLAHLFCTALITPLLSWQAYADDVVQPPNIPVCSGTSCPYVIQKANDSALISCKTAKHAASGFSCTLVASNGGTITTHMDLADHFDSNLNHKWLTPTLLEITDNFQQGRAAYFTERTLFINFKTLKISPIFFNIYAINVAKEVVLCEAAMTENQTLDQHIFVIPMFKSQNSITIERNFSGLYIHDIYPEPITHFMANGNLQLVYFSREHKIVKEIIPIDYKKLEAK